MTLTFERYAMISNAVNREHFPAIRKVCNADNALPFIFAIFITIDYGDVVAVKREKI